MQTIIVIPARYDSSRYPGKPLVKLHGTEAILHSYDAAWSVPGIDAVYVATDDDRIRKVAEAHKAGVLMTSRGCRNGTERVAEAAAKLGLSNDDIIVNFQGDAPLTPPWFIEAIVGKLKRTPEADMVTPVLRCDREGYLQIKEDRKEGRVGAVTAVFGDNGRAMYFSKEPIPYLPNADALAETPVFHHVGVYAYRMPALQSYCAWDIGPLEKAEGLEQLRFLANGGKVYVAEVESRGREFWELNNRSDVAIIERMMTANANLRGITL